LVSKPTEGPRTSAYPVLRLVLVELQRPELKMIGAVDIHTRSKIRLPGRKGSELGAIQPHSTSHHRAHSHAALISKLSAVRGGELYYLQSTNTIVYSIPYHSRSLETIVVLNCSRLIAANTSHSVDQPHSLLTRCTTSTWAAPPTQSRSTRTTAARGHIAHTS
jgi:hypothetical protein